MLRIIVAAAIFIISAVLAPAAKAATPTPWTESYQHGWVDNTGMLVGHFKSAKDACDWQRQKYDPLSTNEDPIPGSGADMISGCRWSDRHTTIVPNAVSYRCIRAWGSGPYTVIFPRSGVVPSGCRGLVTPPQTSCNATGPLDLGAPKIPISSNPVNLATGAKLLNRFDYIDADGKLGIRRLYSTNVMYIPEPTDFGWNWRGLTPISGVIAGLTASRIDLDFTTGDGIRLGFRGNPTGTSYTVDGYDDNRWRVSVVPLFTPPSSANVLTFFQTTDAEWLVTFGDGQRFIVSSSGASSPSNWQQVSVLQHLHPDDYKIDYGYTSTSSTRSLTSITGPGGRSMAISYNAGVPSRIDLPDGTYLAYIYDDATGGLVAKRLRTFERRRADNTLITSEHYIYSDDFLSLFLTGVDGADGQPRARYQYDGRGRVIRTEKGGGEEVWQYEYLPGSVSSRIITRVTNPAGRQTEYEFYVDTGPDGGTDLQLEEVRGIASLTCPADGQSWDYNSSNNNTVKIDKNGRRWEYVYDSLSRPTTVRDGAGTPSLRTNTYTWFGTLNLPTKVLRPRQTLDFARDTVGRILQAKQTDTTTQSVPYSTNGQTRTWDYTYDTQGRVLTEDGPRTDVTDVFTRTYDVAGNLATITNPLSQSVVFSLHDANGNPGRMVDANGATTDLVYDDAGRLTQQIRRSVSGDLTTQFQFDLDGRLTRVTMPDATWLDYEYDPTERVSAILNNSGERVDYTYDAMGLQTAAVTKSATSVITHQISQVNDELGRVRQTVGGAGQSTQFGYDVEDNVTSTTDPLLRTTGFQYDLFNRPTQTTDALSGVAGQAFDPQDNATSITDQRTLQTGFVYNGFEEVIQQVSPDTGTTTFTRDKMGNTTSQTDARGVVTNMSYDAINRLTAVQYPATPAENLAFSYDDTTSGNKGVGKLTGMTDRAGTAAYQFDDRDLLVGEARTISGQAYSTAYGHDASARRASITYPSGRVVEYQRDTLGRISAIDTRDTSVGSLRPVVASVAYKPFGPVSGITHANGIASDRAFDLDYRLTGITDTDGTTPVQQVTFGWDDADNLEAVADALDSTRDQALGYDALDRLTSADGAYGDYDWTYDAAGNRLTEAFTNGGPPANKTYTYGSTSNRLNSISGAENRTFTYTPNGNLATDDRDAADDLTFAYDAGDRLTLVTDPSATVQSAIYDGLGRRVSRTAGGVTRHFHYDDADHLIATSDASGANWIEYVWLGDMPVAQIEGGQIYAIHVDQLNQPVKMTDATKALVWDRQLAPFGGTFAASGGIANDLRFPGQVSDPDTATAYNMARDYDPSIGRYIQADPIGLAGGLNLYGYAHGNPQTLTDPSGNCGPACAAIAAGAANVLINYTIATLSGECYGWRDAAGDFVLGAAGEAAILGAFRFAKFAKFKHAKRRAASPAAGKSPPLAQNGAASPRPSASAKANVIPAKSPSVWDDISPDIHAGKQGKHVPGHNDFIAGRSPLNAGIDPQALLNGARSGQYPIVGTSARGQPIVDFGEIIGRDSASGLYTRFGTIHSGKTGAHIVPANPTNIGNIVP